MLKTTTSIINASQIATPITLPGDITLSTGNLIPATAGKGIDFSANTGAAGMASELLDWYEEGTWTPVITCVTPGDLAITYSRQIGTYTRIGDKVIVNFSIATSAFTHTTASGSLSVTGLPFVANSLANSVSFGSMLFSGITKVGFTQIVPRVSAGLSVFSLLASGSAVAVTSVTIADTPSAGSINFQGTITYSA